MSAPRCWAGVMSRLVAPVSCRVFVITLGDNERPAILRPAGSAGLDTGVGVTAEAALVTALFPPRPPGIFTPSIGRPYNVDSRRALVWMPRISGVAAR